MTTREKPSSSSGTDMTEPRTTELTFTATIRGNVTPEQWHHLQAGDPETIQALEALFADRLTAHAITIHTISRPVVESRTRETEALLQTAYGSPKVWACRVHPTDWWHEVGCPHRSWTEEELRQAGYGHLIDHVRAEVTRG